MATGTLQVNVLGLSFKMDADENSDYLEMLQGRFKRVVQHLEDATGLHNDPLKLSILAGIQLCDEIQRMSDSAVSDGAVSVPPPIDLVEMERLCNDMTTRLDTVL